MGTIRFGKRSSRPDCNDRQGPCGECDDGRRWSRLVAGKGITRRRCIFWIKAVDGLSGPTGRYTIADRFRL